MIIHQPKKFNEKNLHYHVSNELMSVTRWLLSVCVSGIRGYLCNLSNGTNAHVFQVPFSFFFTRFLISFFSCFFFFPKTSSTEPESLVCRGTPPAKKLLLLALPKLPNYHIPAKKNHTMVLLMMMMVMKMTKKEN